MKAIYIYYLYYNVYYTYTMHYSYGCGHGYMTISIGQMASQKFSEEKLYILVKSKDGN